MDTITDSTIAFVRRAIDELVERYIFWREESSAVRIAYQQWVSSDRGERALAYAGYVAALDRAKNRPHELTPAMLTGSGGSPRDCSKVNPNP